jgi:hypothetical protein
MATTTTIQMPGPLKKLLAFICSGLAPSLLVVLHGDWSARVWCCVSF